MWTVVLSFLLWVKKTPASHFVALKSLPIQLAQCCSNFSAEVRAILQVLQWSWLHTQPPAVPFFIYHNHSPFFWTREELSHQNSVTHKSSQPLLKSLCSLVTLALSFLLRYNGPSPFFVFFLESTDLRLASVDIHFWILLISFFLVILYAALATF